ncbi:hypothetical protein EZV62_011367 [Acer yangbiense]|uniref:Phytocyanin domain-containing protein n=1 Tax=Acer yangbiense TaxID=1000413 RepID=A0A5C7I4B2_9ROSI|nr:hypothetical protein EZV62_011367 [Acer yangbiense]
MAGFGISDRSMILIVAIVSMLVTVSVAYRDLDNGGLNYTTHWPWGPGNDTCYKNEPNKIIVGGSDHWRYGFNYSAWASQNAPFYINDVLGHYMACDLSRAKLIANTTQGGGEGFKFVLNRWQPYYFVCGEHGNLHCKDGGMKFFVMPMLRHGFY